MTAPTLELHLRASGLDDVKALKTALVGLNTELAKLGQGGTAVAALAQMNTELKGLRSDLQASFKSLEGTIKTGLAGAFAGAQAEIVKGAAAADAALKTGLDKQIATVVKGREETQRVMTNVNAGTMAAAAASGEALGTAHAEGIKKGLAKITVRSARVNLGDGLVGSASGRGVNSIAAVTQAEAQLKGLPQAAKAAVSATALEIAKLRARSATPIPAETLLGLPSRDSMKTVGTQIAAQMRDGVRVEMLRARSATPIPVETLLGLPSRAAMENAGKQIVAQMRDGVMAEAARLRATANLARRQVANAMAAPDGAYSVPRTQRLVDPFAGQAGPSPAMMLAQQAAMAQQRTAFATPLGNYSLISSMKEVDISAQRGTVSMRGFTGQLRDAHSAARGLASGFGAMWLTWGNIVPLLAGAALANSFVQTIKIGAEVNNTLKQMEVLGGETAESVGYLSDQMIKLGKSSQFGPKETTQAMKLMILAGLQAHEVYEALPTVLNFAVAGDLDIMKAADAMTTVGVAFGISAKNYSYIADVVAKAAAESKSSVEGIAAAFKTASVVNSQYGASLEDVAVTLSLLANASITGTMAGTSVRNMFVDLGGRTPKVQKALKELGVELKDVATGKLRPLGDAFRDLMTSLQKYSAKDQYDFLQRIFSERGGRAGIQVLEALRDKANETGESIANTWMRLDEAVRTSAGYVATATAQMALTPLNQMKSVAAALQTAMVETFKKIEPQVLEMSARLRELFNSEEFRNGLASMVKLVAGLTTAIFENGRTIVTVVALYAGLKGVASIMGVVTAAQVAWTAAQNAHNAAVAAGVTASAAARLATSGVATAASMAHPVLAALVGIVTALASAWMVYQMWANKGKTAIDEIATGNSAKALLERLTAETDRLHNVNEARTKGISLMRLEAEANLAKARSERSTDQAKAQDALRAHDSRVGLEVEAFRLRGGDPKILLDKFRQERRVLAAELDLADQDQATTLRRIQEEMLNLTQLEKRAHIEGRKESAARVPVAGTKTLEELEKENKNKDKWKFRELRDEDRRTIEDGYRKEESALRTTYENQMKLVESKRSNDLISMGAYQAEVLQNTHAFEEQKKAMMVKALEDHLAETDSNREKVKALLLFASEDQKTDLENRLKNLTSLHERFSTELKASQVKMESDAATRRQIALDRMEGDLVKMTKANEEYIQKAENSVTKEAELAKSRQELANASEEVRARREAEIRVESQHADELGKLQRAYKALQQAVDDYSMSFEMGQPITEEVLAVYAALGKSAEAAAQHITNLRQAMIELKQRSGDTAELEVQNKQINEWRKQAKEMGDQFTGRMADAILSGGKSGGKDFLNWFKDELKKPFRMVIQASLQWLSNGIAGLAFGGLQASGGGTASGIMGMFSNGSSLLRAGSSLYNSYSMGGFSGMTGSGASGGGMMGTISNWTGMGYGSAMGPSSFSSTLGGGFATDAMGATVGQGSAATGAAGASMSTMAAGAASIAVIAYAFVQMYKNLKGEKRSGGGYGFNALTGEFTEREKPSGGNANSEADKALIQGTTNGINATLIAMGSSRRVTSMQAAWESSTSGRGGVYAGGTFDDGTEFGESGRGSNYNASNPGNSKYEFGPSGFLATSDMDGSPEKLAIDIQQAYLSAIQASVGLIPKWVEREMSAQEVTDNLGGSGFGTTSLTGTTQWVREYDETIRETIRQSGALPKRIADLILDIDPEALSDELTKEYATKIGKMVADVNGFRAIVDTMPVEQMRNASFDVASYLVELAGSVENFGNNLKAYVDNFYSEEEKRQFTVSNIHRTVSAAGGKWNEWEIANASRAQFRAAVEAAGTKESLATEEGRKLYDALMKVAGAFASITPLAEDVADSVSNLADELAKAVDDAFSLLERAIDAEKKRLNAQYDTTIAALNLQIDAQDKAVSKIKSLADLLSSTLSQFNTDQTLGMSRDTAMSQVRDAVRLARSGGTPDSEALQDPLGVLTRSSTDGYSSFIEYARAFDQQVALVAELNGLTQAQLTHEELILKQLRDNADYVENQHRESIQALDDLLEEERRQMDIFKGIDVSVVSVQEAVTRLYDAFLRANPNMRPPTGAPAAGGGTGSGGPFVTGAGQTGNGTANTARPVAEMSLREIVNSISGFGTADDERATLTLASFVRGRFTAAEIGAELGFTEQQVKDHFAKYRIPGFAAGGLHSGGLRLVGERGPELEVTGPARIYSNTQTERMLNGYSSNGDTAAVVRAINNMAQQQYEINTNMLHEIREIKKIHQEWNEVGVPTKELVE